MNALDADGAPSVQRVQVLRALMRYPAAAEIAAELPADAWPCGFVRAFAAWIIADGPIPDSFPDSRVWLTAIGLDGRPHDEADARYLVGLVAEWNTAAERVRVECRVLEAGRKWDRAARSEETHKARYLAARAALWAIDGSRGIPCTTHGGTRPSSPDPDPAPPTTGP